MRQLTDLQKIAVDLYKGGTPANFSKREAEDVLREEISALICKDGVPNHNKFSENKWKVYALLEDVFAPVAQPYELPEQIRNLIRTETIGHRESKEFEIGDNELFKVYKVSDGNLDIRRQTTYAGRVAVNTEWYSIKIYAELSDFLAGKIDWVGMINKVNASISDYVAREMAKLFTGVTNPVDTGTGAFDANVLIRLIQAVKDKYKSQAVIYGNMLTLGKIQDIVQSEKSKEEFNSIGYYGQFRGTPVMELPVEGNDLIILPYNGSPIGLVVVEGTPIVRDSADFGERNDMQLELFTAFKMGFVAIDIGGAKYELA